MKCKCLRRSEKFVFYFCFSCFNPLQPHVHELIANNRRWAQSEHVLFVVITSGIYIGQLMSGMLAETLTHAFGWRILYISV